MSCKSAIYTVSTAVQAVVAGNSLSLGSTIRRFGCSTTLSGNAIALNAPGYYDVDVSVTAIPTAAGTVSVTLFQDGVAVPGAVASATTTAATNSVNLSLSAMVRVLNGSNVSNLTLVISGAASSVTNVAYRILSSYAERIYCRSRSGK